MWNTFVYLILLGNSLSSAWRPDADEKVSLIPGAAGQMEVAVGNQPNRTPNISASFVEKDAQKGVEQKAALAATAKQGKQASTAVEHGKDAIATAAHGKVADGTLGHGENLSTVAQEVLSAEVAHPNYSTGRGDPYGRQNQYGRQDQYGRGTNDYGDNSSSYDDMDSGPPRGMEDDMSYLDDNSSYDSRGDRYGRTNPRGGPSGKYNNPRGYSSGNTYDSRGSDPDYGRNNSGSDGSARMEVVCPPNDEIKNGTIMVRTPATKAAPNGVLKIVTVPRGIRPGQKFYVNYDMNAIETGENTAPGNGSDMWSGTVRLSSGQELRGVIDSFGEAWAIKFDKNKMERIESKRYYTKWFRGNETKKKGGAVGRSWRKKNDQRFDYTKVEIPVDIKLLKHSDFHDNIPVPNVKDALARNEIMQAKLTEGWQNRAIIFEGWWNDQLAHFQGKAFARCDTRKSKYCKEPGRASGDRNWILWAFIPWKKIDMRFDANGANVIFEWRPGGDVGIRRHFKSNRNGYSKDRIRRQFRFQARPDVDDKELKNIYVSGVQPMRGEWIQMTMRMYEWQKTGVDSAKGAMNMRLVDLITKDVDDREKGALGYQYDYDTVVEGTKSKWFQFIGEEGTWSFDIKPDDEFRGSQYIMTNRASSCLSAYGVGNLSGGNCPFLRNAYQAYEFKSTGKAVFIRPTVPSMNQAKYGKDIIEKKGIIFKKKKVVGRDYEVRFEYALYPIYDDDKMENWAENILNWDADIGDKRSVKLSQMAIQWGGGKGSSNNNSEHVVEATHVGGGNDDSDYRGGNRSNANETRRLKGMLMSKDQQIRMLREQNDGLQARNKWYEKTIVDEGKKILAGERMQANYVGDIQRMQNDERMMRDEIQEIRGEWMIYNDPQRGPLLEPAAKILGAHHPAVLKGPNGMPIQTRGPSYTLHGTPEQNMAFLGQFDQGLNNDMTLNGQHIRQEQQMQRQLMNMNMNNFGPHPQAPQFAANGFGAPPQPPQMQQQTPQQQVHVHVHTDSASKQPQPPQPLPPPQPQQFPQFSQPQQPQQFAQFPPPMQPQHPQMQQHPFQPQAAHVFTPPQPQMSHGGHAYGGGQFGAPPQQNMMAPQMVMANGGNAFTGVSGQYGNLPQQPNMMAPQMAHGGNGFGGNQFGAPPQQPHMMAHGGAPQMQMNGGATYGAAPQMQPHGGSYGAYPY